MVGLGSGQTFQPPFQPRSSGATTAQEKLSVECAKNPNLPTCSDLQVRPESPFPNRIDLTPERPATLDQNRVDRIKEGPPIPQEPTEFQEFVAASLGRQLPLFGETLFDQVPSTFAPVDRIAVPSEYVIGPGDELLLRAWGQIDLDARVVVDRNGSIYLPRVGSIMVAGLQYKQLSEFLKTNIGRIFRNFDLSVTLGQLRSIQIFVVGQARHPGAYTVSSLSTLVNALFASGGPSNRGSMRHIQLKRNGVVVADFDFYDLLIKGDKSKDEVLLPGDVIYIPPTGPQVAIAGSVNSPAIYELASSATLKEQIAIAGGLTTVADGDRVIVERIDARNLRKVEEFKLDESGLQRRLSDGDIVRVFPISPRFENAVTLRGNVAQPGRYPWHEGMRIRELIPDRNFLLTRDFWEQQNSTADDKKFGSGRELKQVTDLHSLRATGLNKMKLNDKSGNDADDPSKEKLLEDVKGDTLKNDIKRNAPEINWEYAVIQRLDRNTLAASLIPFNLGKAVLEGGGVDNQVLQAGDIVTIFSQADISVSVEHQTKFVRLEGELQAPGVYKVEQGETLRELVRRAGGLTGHAYLYGSEFTRKSVQLQQQRSLNEMVRSLEEEIQRKTMYGSQAHPEQQAAILAQSQVDQAFLEKLRSVKPTGRVVLELKPTQTTTDDIPELPLEDGDRITVPSKPATVTVVGAVYNQSSFVFQDGASIKRFLTLAGGGNRNADTKHMFLVRADGSVVSKEQVSGIWRGGFDSVRTLPGDMLVVPTQIDKGSFVRGLRDWSQIISQFALGAAAAYVFMK
jgi:protein involved in polysaccharide export with SLBB domain